MMLTRLRSISSKSRSFSTFQHFNTPSVSQFNNFKGNEFSIKPLPVTKQIPLPVAKQSPPPLAKQPVQLQTITRTFNHTDTHGNLERKTIINIQFTAPKKSTDPIEDIKGIIYYHFKNAQISTPSGVIKDAIIEDAKKDGYDITTLTFRHTVKQTWKIPGIVYDVFHIIQSLARR